MTAYKFNQVFIPFPNIWTSQNYDNTIFFISDNSTSSKMTMDVAPSTSYNDPNTSSFQMSLEKSSGMYELRLNFIGKIYNYVIFLILKN